MAALLARRIEDGREARRVIDGVRDGAERYAQEMLNHLLQAGTIDQETWGRAAEAAQARALNASTRWQDGAIRGLQSYAAEAGNAARGVERLMTGTFGQLEDALTKFVTSGKADFGDFIDGVIADFTRLMIRTTITGPLANAASAGLGALFRDLFRADGGPVEAGRPYIVGERGWELFVPDRPGRIIPADRVGFAAETGGVTIIQHVAIDARGADAGVEARLRAVLAQHKEETANEVFARIGRGGADRGTAIMDTLSFPAVRPSSAEWHLWHHTQTATSPLTRAAQTLELPGALWTASLRFERLSEAQWRALAARLARMRGAAGRCRLSPPHAGVPRGVPAGAPVVVAGSTGRTLRTAGWTASAPRVLAAGDYLSYAVGVGGRQLHVVAADVAAGADGTTLLPVEPPIRVPPSVGTPLVTTDPTCVMRLADDEQGRLRLTPPLRGSLSLDFVEVFG